MSMNFGRNNTIGDYGGQSMGGGNMGGGQANNGGPQQQGGPIQNGNGQQGLDPNAPAPQPEYTLAGILHFLQSEWRRYERDRNEWEIERAEMRARIALLEGERRGSENLKTDLMRRVKMLEYALRQERSKYLSLGSTAGAGAGAGAGSVGTGTGTPGAGTLPIAKHLQNLEKSASGSGRSSPARSEAETGVDAVGGAHARNVSNMSTATFNTNTMPSNTLNGSTFGSTLGGASTNLLSRQLSSAKDGKTRAKSREYLKQCLQEITYLTSATTLNPLPDRAIGTANATAGGAAAAGSQGPPRPRKLLSENVPPPPLALQQQHLEQQPQQSQGFGGPTQGSLRRAGPTSSDVTKSVGRPTAFATNRSRLSDSYPEGTVFETRSSSIMMRPPPVEEDEFGVEGKSEGSGDDGNPSSGRPLSPVNLPYVTEPDRDDIPPQSPVPGTTPLPLNSADAEFAAQSSEDVIHDSDSTGSSGGSASTEGSELSDSTAATSDTGVTATENSDVNETASDGPEQLTAIFRPAGGAGPNDSDWAKLKQAGLAEREKRERERKKLAEEQQDAIAGSRARLESTTEQVNRLMRANSSMADRADEDDLARLTLATDSDETATKSAEFADANLWKPKRVLKSHLDAVRALAFDNQGLFSASDDCTIKFWEINPNALAQGAVKGATDPTPILSFRGHNAPVTCVAVSTSQGRVFSGSMDASVRIWKVPTGPLEPYPPYDPSIEAGTFIGHSQAIWDLALLPQRNVEDALLATASADGTVKIWKTEEGAASPLLLSWDYFGTDPSSAAEEERATIQAAASASDQNSQATPLPVPTSIAPCHFNLRLCAVSYTNSVVKLFEIETGKQTLQLKSDDTYDGTPATQINKVLTHPTMHLIVTAHEDKYIRMFDIDTGRCTLSMLAHLDSVTNLDIDPAGLTLVSGGHDCSVRFWDIVDTLNFSPEAGVAGGALNAANATLVRSSARCVQEMTSHRKKATEGVLAVKYHPTAPFFASAGADGVVRIYG